MEPKKRKKIEVLVKDAVQGSKIALEEIIGRIQEPVYSLSLRMLLDPEDAKDTVQEILIAVITNLRGYRHEGPFRAWVMRIAVNKLRSVRKSRAENKMSTVDNLEAIIDRYEARGWFSKPRDIPEPYLEAETRAVCTHAILLCLDRSHRMAFILGVVMEVSSRDGAHILGISPDAYRKRLSRARSKIKLFLMNNCGLFSSSTRCRCSSLTHRSGWPLSDRRR